MKKKNQGQVFSKTVQKRWSQDDTHPEAVARRCSVEKVFLEISQNSQEKHMCQSLFFNKVAG